MGRTKEFYQTVFEEYSSAITNAIDEASDTLNPAAIVEHLTTTGHGQLFLGLVIKEFVKEVEANPEVALTSEDENVRKIAKALIKRPRKKRTTKKVEI